MQLFKTFFKIAYKRKVTTIIYLCVFIALTLLFTNTIEDSFQGNFKSQELNIVVEDEDQSVASNGLVSYLQGMHNVTLEKIDKQSLSDRIYYRQVQYAIKIPKGFEEKLRNGETKNLIINTKIPGSNSSYYADEQISQYLQCLQIYLKGGISVDKAVQKTIEGFEKTPEVNMMVFHQESGKVNHNIFYFYQYMSYVLILISVTGLTPILNKLNEKNVKARMICSSYEYKKQIVATIISCGVYSVMMFLVFEVLGLIVYGTDIFASNIKYAALNSIVYLLFAVGIAIILSCFSLGDSALNMIGNMGALAMAFMCGTFVPQSILPEKVLRVGHFLPTYWYIKNNNMLAGFGSEVFDMNIYWSNLGIECLFVIATFIAVLVLTKKKSMRL